MPISRRHGATALFSHHHLSAGSVRPPASVAQWLLLAHQQRRAFRPARRNVSQCQGLHKAALAVGPLCATRFASTNPGAGLSQSSKVRTATLRLIAAEGGACRRLRPPLAFRASRNARLIVAALIDNKSVRTSTVT
jgi:hypothetical protein